MKTRSGPIDWREPLLAPPHVYSLVFASLSGGASSDDALGYNRRATAQARSG